MHICPGGTGPIQNVFEKQNKILFFIFAVSRKEISQFFVGGGGIICVMFGKQPPYPVNTYGLHYKRI